MVDPELVNLLSNDRLTSRQVDELIGIARGVCADGNLNQAEAEFILGWLANNRGVVESPLISSLYQRVAMSLADGELDGEERAELFCILRDFSAGTMEVGEALKATSLPLCDPSPPIVFVENRFCFTGTFNFGSRKDCERAVLERGGEAGSLTKNTDYLVIGVYATESWKHSTFGNKIMKAVELRDEGVPVSIVSEEHWRRYLG